MDLWRSYLTILYCTVYKYVTVLGTGILWFCLYPLYSDSTVCVGVVFFVSLILGQYSTVCVSVILFVSPTVGQCSVCQCDIVCIPYTVGQCSVYPLWYCLYPLSELGTRQHCRDNVFRPCTQLLVIALLLYISCSFRNPDLNIFGNYSCPWSSITLTLPRN